MILFSVIIPTYNRAAFIERAIESVLAQTYTNWELIVIDDASKDDTFRIIQSYADSRISLFRNDTNIERSATRNKGIKLAKGEYICFLDSDDYYYPNHLQLLSKNIETRESPVAMFHTTACVVDENDVLIEILKYSYDDKDELVERVISHHIQPNTVAVHRTIFSEVEFDAHLIINEDVCLFAQIAALYPIVYIDYPTVAWVKHRSNTIHQFKNHIDLQLLATRKIFSDPLIFKKLSVKFKKDKYFDLYSQLLYNRSVNKKRLSSIRYFIKAFLIHPFRKKNMTNLLNVLYHLPGGGWLKKLRNSSTKVASNS